MLRPLAGNGVVTLALIGIRSGPTETVRPSPGWKLSTLTVGAGISGRCTFWHFVDDLYMWVTSVKCCDEVQNNKNAGLEIM